MLPRLTPTDHELLGFVLFDMMGERKKNHTEDDDDDDDDW